MNESTSPIDQMLIATCPNCEEKNLIYCSNCHSGEHWNELNEERTLCHCGQQTSFADCPCGTRIMAKFFARPTEEEIEAIEKEEAEAELGSLISSSIKGVLVGSIFFFIYIFLVPGMLMTINNPHAILAGDAFFKDKSILTNILTFIAFFLVARKTILGAFLSSLVGTVLAAFVIIFAPLSFISTLAFIAIPLLGLIVTRFHDDSTD